MENITEKHVKNNPQKICLVGLPVAWPVRAEKLKQEALEQLAQTHNKLKQTNRKTNNWKNKENTTKKGNHIIEYTKKTPVLKQTNKKTNS